MTYPSLFARLVANTAEPDSPTGCWTWTGPRRGSHGARPSICIRGPRGPRNHNAARVMLEQVGETLALGDEASHLCRYNWLCINPDHLVVEGHADNVARRYGRTVAVQRRDVVPLDEGIPW